MKLVHWVFTLSALVGLAVGLVAMAGGEADAGKGGRRGGQQQLIVAPACTVNTSFTLASGASETFELSGCEAFTQFAFYSQFAHPGQETAAFDSAATDQQVTATAPNGTVYCSYPVCDDHNDTLDYFPYAQPFPMASGVWTFGVSNHGSQSLQISVLAGGN